MLPLTLAACLSRERGNCSWGCKQDPANIWAAWSPCLPTDGEQRRESPKPLVCVNVPPVSRVLPRGRGWGPLRQLRSQLAAKEALFLDPDCDRPPGYSCYLWSNCPGLNLNSFSIIA